MPIIDSLRVAEAEAGTRLEPQLHAHSDTTERAFNTVGLVLGAAPEIAFRDVSLSRRVATLLMVRLSNDLRGVALLALRGYSLQAAALVASMYEVAYCIAYIGSDESRADAWVKHDDPAKPFRNVKALTEEVFRSSGVDDAEKSSAAQYRVYRQLCLAKHSNPLLQQHYGHCSEDEAIVVMNGPDTSDESLRVAQFALEHSARLTVLALASFMNHHVPDGGRPPLVERLQSIWRSTKDLAQGAIVQYGNENPFPGEW